MTTCIICGRDSEGCLCSSCKQNVDIETICKKLAAYKPGNGENDLWDKLSSQLSSPYNFKDIVFDISAELPYPRNVYMQILCLAGNREFIPKESRSWLYDKYAQLCESDGLSEAEKNRVRSYVLMAYTQDYSYEKAEEIMNLILNSGDNEPFSLCAAADFLIKTRRYDKVNECLTRVKQLNDETISFRSEALKEEYEKRRIAPQSGKKEYLPGTAEAKEKYKSFLASLGIEIKMPISQPKPIPREEYPEPNFTADDYFDSFVAFDFETTGFDATKDSIIEIGAVRVINGRVDESSEFVFQELVKPLDSKKVSSKITELTGITQDDVVDKRPVWEVIKDFKDFVGDNVLVGFNNEAFDSKFLTRAGRYGHIIFDNTQFDVMKYAKNNAGLIGLEPKMASLEYLSEKLDVVNPQAHRALADALTTAVAYLKIKEMRNKNKEEPLSALDLLSDIDNW